MSRRGKAALAFVSLAALALIAATPVVEEQSRMHIFEIVSDADSLGVFTKADFPDSGRSWSKITKVGIKGPTTIDAASTARKDTLLFRCGPSERRIERMPYWSQDLPNLDVFEISTSQKISQMALGDTIVGWFFRGTADTVMVHVWGY